LISALYNVQNIIRLLKDMSNLTMNNMKMQLQYRSQHSNKTTLISTVKQHVGIVLGRGWCYRPIT